ncbi:MAG: serine/threonine-protein kinase [Pirellulaceae bacterium]|nr:serine/threonine-protein kinase [Pirellulaceae bacterium]
MLKTPHCLESATLQSMLDQTLPANQLLTCEHHLESCESCRQSLESLAGEACWWEDAAEMLSSDFVNVAGELGTKIKSQSVAKSRDADEDAKTLALKQVRELLATPRHPEMLGRIGEYDIESFIGQGGFGVVLRAFDRELNRPVAIKILAPHLATVGAARRRFIREAQAAAAVVHPNVVPIHAVHADADHPFLVMTYVPGCSLQEFVRQQGPLETKVIVRIAQQVASGLAAAHRQGLVHRDIKPGNILLENGLNRALITDFGLARAADDAASQTGWLAGTPHYMSPEQAACGELDGRSDLFSLGCVLYFVATGREPFRGSQPLAIMNQIANQKPLPVRSVNSDISQVLAQVIERLLEKKPSDRFQSAAELSDFLEQYVAYLHQPETRIKPQVPRKRGTTLMASTAWLGSAIALLIAAVVYGSGVWSTPTTRRDIGVAPAAVARPPIEAAANIEPPTTFPLAAVQQALLDWVEEERQLEQEFVRLRQDLIAAEDGWQNAPRHPFFVSEFGYAPLNLTAMFQEIRTEIDALEKAAFRESQVPATNGPESTTNDGNMK